MIVKKGTLFPFGITTLLVQVENHLFIFVHRHFGGIVSSPIRFLSIAFHHNELGSNLFFIEIIFEKRLENIIFCDMRFPKLS